MSKILTSRNLHNIQIFINKNWRWLAHILFPVHDAKPLDEEVSKSQPNGKPRLRQSVVLDSHDILKFKQGFLFGNPQWVNIWYLLS